MMTSLQRQRVAQFLFAQAFDWRTVYATILRDGKGKGIALGGFTAQLIRQDRYLTNRPN